MADDHQFESVPEPLNTPPPQRKKKNKKRNRKWSSDLDAVEIGPFLFVPLTCTKDLREEGEAMAHCVRTYEDLCRLDCTRIFSVRDALSRTRLATLSLIWEDDNWHLDQIKGPMNADIDCRRSSYLNGEEFVTELEPTDLHYAAMELVQLYRENWLNNQHSPDLTQSSELSLKNICGTWQISASSLSDFEAADLDIYEIEEWVRMGDDPAIRRRRIDLANNLPILIPMLVFDPDNLWSQDLAHKLDRGASPLECLTAVFPTKRKESANVLIGMPFATLADWSSEVFELMLAIDCLEVDELPESDAEWYIFLDFAKALYPCEGTLSGYVFQSLFRMSYLSPYEALKNITEKDPSKLSLIAAYARHQGCRYAGLLGYPASGRPSVASEVVSIPWASEKFRDACNQLAEAKLMQFSAIDLLLQALRWNEALGPALLKAQVNSDDPHLATWPPLFAAPVVTGSYQVVSMASAVEVASGCAALHLDLGTVLSECALGDSHIVVLSDMNGVTRTVAKIWIKGPEAGFFVAYTSEHFGEGRRYAYQDECDALASALELFWESEFQYRLVRLREFHRQRRSIVEQKLDELRYRNDVMEAALGSGLPSSLMSIHHDSATVRGSPC